MPACHPRTARVRAVTRWIAAGLIALPGLASAQSASVDRMRQDMAALSTDAMTGRFPGTPGETRTLAYLRNALARAGAKPAGGKWLQRVAMVSRTRISSGMTVTAGGQAFDLSNDVILLGQRRRETIADVPLVYAGHAEAKADLRGAIALFRDTQQATTALPTPADTPARMAMLAASGARGALAIMADASFDNRRARTGATLWLPEDFPLAVRGVIRESAARRLLAAMGQDLAQLDAAAKRDDFRAAPLPARATVQTVTTIAPVVSYNVTAMIAGTKANAGAVLYTAHWDGLGHCQADNSRAICNGAIDNASGLAALVELVRLFRAGPSPEHAILFVATTAEEQGLIGSRAYARAPVVPLARTVAAINLDTLALHRRGQPVGIVGGGLTTADGTIERLIAAQRRRSDRADSNGPVYKNSDAWPLLKSGVPAFVLSGTIARSGTDNGAAFREFIAKRVHTPRDVMDPAVPLDGMAEDVDLAYRVGHMFSAAGTTIDFLTDAPFRRPPAR
jgi:hypothetical protein